jgi:hypothetical protein
LSRTKTILKGRVSGAISWGVGALRPPDHAIQSPPLRSSSRRKGQADTTHRGLDPFLSALADDPDWGPVRHHDEPPTVGKVRYARARNFGDRHGLGPIHGITTAPLLEAAHVRIGNMPNLHFALVFSGT